MNAPEPDDRFSTLPRAFFARPTVDVARDLLGRYLVLHRDAEPKIVGRLVELEAYLGEGDRASHSWHGRTRRTAPMYEAPGHAYMYFVYGMYWCLNVVTEDVGQPCAVLVRGVEPIDGLALATNGPGRVCRAYGLDGSWNRADLTSGDLQVTTGEPVDSDLIASSPRIGVDYAEEWTAKPLRFFVSGNPHVSRPPKPRRHEKPTSQAAAL